MGEIILTFLIESASAQLANAEPALGGVYSIVHGYMMYVAYSVRSSCCF